MKLSFAPLENGWNFWFWTFRKLCFHFYFLKLYISENFYKSLEKWVSNQTLFCLFVSKVFKFSNFEMFKRKNGGNAYDKFRNSQKKTRKMFEIYPVFLPDVGTFSTANIPLTRCELFQSVLQLLSLIMATREMITNCCGGKRANTCFLLFLFRNYAFMGL